MSAGCALPADSEAPLFWPESCSCTLIPHFFLGKGLGSHRYSCQLAQQRGGMFLHKQEHPMLWYFPNEQLDWHEMDPSFWLIAQAYYDSEWPKEESKGIFTLPHTTPFSWAHSFGWTLLALWCHGKHPQEVLLQTRNFLDSVGDKLQVKTRHLKSGCQKGWRLGRLFTCLPPSRKNTVVVFCWPVLLRGDEFLTSD